MSRTPKVSPEVFPKATMASNSVDAHFHLLTGRGDNSYKPKKTKVARAMTGIAGVDSTYPLDHLLSISTYLLGDTLQFDSDDEAWPGETNTKSPKKRYKAIVQEGLPELLQSEDTPSRPGKQNNSTPILCNELDISQFPYPSSSD
ncbi:uncharacterized protein APUU_30106S [Aspergillus puulaauensis]|uniref:Uncharacterized protein n=1 Tax=Aspergillus puulaauensis TaxID=1220207 RepID=A0A7R8AK57_9EURO|nr:uncharacterized protein APUU_30106S [Aspergillus puulaauensis]BCS21881.1 hypothetical protein APUU_30106S [Aspergillus puulaauensis]